MTKPTHRRGLKSAYKTPSLVHFGSVRNLTGGSVGDRPDGMGTMAGRTNMGMGMGMGMG